MTVCSGGRGGSLLQNVAERAEFEVDWNLSRGYVPFAKLLHVAWNGDSAMRRLGDIIVDLLTAGLGAVIAYLLRLHQIQWPCLSYGPHCRDVQFNTRSPDRKQRFWAPP